MNVSKFAAPLLALAVIAAACASDQTTRNESGSIVEGGDLGVFVVQEGDCINLPDSAEDLSSFTGVACDEPHDAQAFSLFDVADAELFPGEEVVQNQAQAGCIDRFETFIGLSYNSSIYFLQFVMPTEETWEAIDDRAVICLVTPASGQDQLTRDLRGIGE